MCRLCNVVGVIVAVDINNDSGLLMLTIMIITMMTTMTMTMTMMLTVAERKIIKGRLKSVENLDCAHSTKRSEPVIFKNATEMTRYWSWDNGSQEKAGRSTK
uniref:Uncharacterized protein n=1 Tax=Glossina austeni TaxID=7395 RepID=A0A1A9UDX5_GLOAU